jgi:hypothetical protein
MSSNILRILACLAAAAVLVILVVAAVNFETSRSMARIKASCAHWYALDPKEDITAYELARIVSGGTGGSGLGGPVCEEKEGAIPADLRRHFRELAQ